jgi:hypothetical protein
MGIRALLRNVTRWRADRTDRLDPEAGDDWEHERATDVAAEVTAAWPATFTCADCGRTDLPEAGDWDPPICLECDAAINEDAIQAYETEA